MKSNISLIIPVHSLKDDNEKDMLKFALTSVAKQKVQPEEIILVLNKEIKKEFKYDGDLTIRVILNDGPTDFQSQLNLGVENVKTEWFTFLEFDDEMSSIWLDNAVKYIAEKTEMSVFLPIIVDVKTDGSFLGFTNEILWANSFSDVLGELDHEVLKIYQNFNIDGMVMRKDTYQKIGGLKASIKQTFIYEFLLRLTYNSVKIMTIPRLGYKHVNNRENSLFDIYKQTVSDEESVFWQDLALKEFYHTFDRKITYDK
jgi:glycosyltransferase involved in cell wall biosynthesis